MMTRVKALTAIASAAALALALSACTDGSDTNPSDPTSSSGEPTTSRTATIEPKDRSQQVFDAYTPDKVIGSTSGKIRGFNSNRPSEDVTFEVLSVEATSDATILRFQLTATDSPLLHRTGADWTFQPTLRPPGAKVRTQTLTAALPKYDERSYDVCVCTSVYGAGSTPQPQEVVYPPLPTDVTEVDVILDELDPVTVPVSR